MKNLKALLFFFSMVVCAQVKQDLKAGLILSGGGAKGIAHVGVLKEIKRAGPIELTAAYSPQFSRLLFHVNIGWQF